MEGIIMTDISTTFGVLRYTLPNGDTTSVTQNIVTKEVLVQADPANTGNVYVSAGSIGGIYLVPGAGIAFKVNNTNVVRATNTTGASQALNILWRG